MHPGDRMRDAASVSAALDADIDALIYERDGLWIPDPDERRVFLRDRRAEAARDLCILSWRGSPRRRSSLS